MVLSLDRWVGKVAIVTGVSAGIGAAIVETLVQSGLIVVGVARRLDRIEELAKKLTSEKGKLYPFKADVTKEDDIIKVFEWTGKNLGLIHILVNNAGVLRQGDLIDGKTEDWLQVLNTNVLGLSIATREAARTMRDNHIEGHIIHINSILGHSVPYPFGDINMYPASKYAVTALTETLRQTFTEKKIKIKITSISPGTVETELLLKSSDDEALARASYEQKNNLTPVLNSEDVADAVAYVLSTPPHVQVHELIIKPVGEPF